jgi:hypothetical protein
VPAGQIGGATIAPVFGSIGPGEEMPMAAMGTSDFWIAVSIIFSKRGSVTAGPSWARVGSSARSYKW